MFILCRIIIPPKSISNHSLTRGLVQDHRWCKVLLPLQPEEQAAEKRREWGTYRLGRNTSGPPEEEGKEIDDNGRSQRTLPIDEIQGLDDFTC